jgi:ferritin-like metal-binding protein YciE
MKIREPQDLLLEEMRAIHSAERQLQRALPKLGRNIENQEILELFQERIEQGRTLIDTLDDAFESFGANRGRRKNAAAEGLIDEAEELAEAIEDPTLRAAALVAAVQKLEHYCIAAWGSTRAMGQAFGEEELVQAMETLLEEGKRHDEQLTTIAERELYPRLQGETGGQSQRSTSSRTQGSAASTGGGARTSGKRGGDAAQQSSGEQGQRASASTGGQGKS